MIKKRKVAIMVGCILLIALVGFGLSGVWRSDTPISAEAPSIESAETERAAHAIDETVVPAETSLPTSATDSSITHSPAPATNGTEENPQGGDNEPQDIAGGTANDTPSTPVPAPPATVAPDPVLVAPPAPAAPDLAPVVTPAPTPPTTPAPDPQPEQPPNPNYAYCSCGSVLTAEELTAHMKQHALNGEGHHYDTY